MSESQNAEAATVQTHSNSVCNDNPVSSTGIENRVTFRPNLHDWRRAWILDILRKEKVTTVLDIGCGEGSLLMCLSYPSFFLTGPSSPDRETDPLIDAAVKQADGSDVHLKQITGLDLSLRELEECVQATEPYPDEPHASRPRWEPLVVDLWHGSLAVANDAFKNYECIVSSEVIEHLPPDVLPFFAPTLLGLYEPRLLLITTPNYSFNARFTPPGVVDPYKYVDPTGRTSRVFRHSDHKFEWTVEEFTEWCEGAAQEWGYEVKVDAIGTPMEKDPWGRDEQLGKATQVATFVRVEGDETTKQRARRWREFKTKQTSNCKQEQPHTLIKTHFHEPHLRTRQPLAESEIAALASKYMEEYYTEEGYVLGDLWIAPEISIACGGYIKLLVDALLSSAEFNVDKYKPSANDVEMTLPLVKWQVFFVGEKHLEAIARTDKNRLWPRVGWEATSETSSQHSEQREGEDEAEEQDESVKAYDSRWQEADTTDDDDEFSAQTSGTTDLELQNRWSDSSRTRDGWDGGSVEAEWGTRTDWDGWK